MDEKRGGNSILDILGEWLWDYYIEHFQNNMSAFVPITKSPSRRKSSSKSPDKSPKYEVGDEFFTKYYKFNIRIKDIDSKTREYVFEKAYDKNIKTEDERRILDDKDLKLKFNVVDDFPKIFWSMQGDGYGHKGGRKKTSKKRSTRSRRY